MTVGKREVSPKITILMPIFNCAKFLGTAIDSILCQTEADFELVIIDDSSTDASQDIVRSYADPRIRLFVNECNMGVAKTLNKGLAYARGKYIARMDGDDICLPTRLAAQASFLDAHPEVDLCGSWVKIFSLQNDAIVFLHTRTYPLNHEAINCQMLFDIPFTHSTIMFRRELYQNGDYLYPLDNHSEDYALWVRLIKKYRFANLPQILLHYRMSADQVTSRKRNLFTKDIQLIQRRELSLLGIEATEEDMTVHTWLYRNLDETFVGKPFDYYLWSLLAKSPKSSK